MKPPLTCLVTWPIGPSGSAALDAVAQPHSCALAANHVHRTTTRVVPGRKPVVEALPHLCLCGSTQPVRDVEVAS